MRLPRLRLRLWTLLIAVAVAGLAMGGWQIWRRREHCLNEAAWHARQEQLSNEGIVLFAKGEASFRNLMEEARRAGETEEAEELAREVERYRAQEELERAGAGFHASKQREFLRAASRPWDPLPSDP